MATTLDPEKRIENLKNRISELKVTSQEENIDLSKEIATLESKVKNLEEEIMTHLSAWEKLSIARMVERPTALDYIESIFEDFIELHGDRQYRDDSAIVAGVGFLEDVPVTVIGQQKGRNTKENIERNFGMPHPEGYRKALRFMKQAEKFNRPIICFVDTPGAFCGVEAEERGQGEAIARNLIEMADLKVPIISIIIGEGGSGGALAMAVADEVWMLEHSVYSILTPEGFATILWKDSKRSKEAAEIMKITAQDLKGFGIIDRVIDEPLGGAHKDLDSLSKNLKVELIKKISELINVSTQELVDNRYAKYRKLGVYVEGSK